VAVAACWLLEMSVTYTCEVRNDYLLLTRTVNGRHVVCDVSYMEFQSESSSSRTGSSTVAFT